MAKNKSADQAQLKDGINEELRHKLLHMKSELKAEEEKRKEHQKAESIRKKKEIEKNKSFEELLNESGLDWKQYK